MSNFSVRYSQPPHPLLIQILRNFLELGMTLHNFTFNMAGVGDNSDPIESSPDLENQKKEIAEAMNKPLVKGDIW